MPRRVASATMAASAMAPFWFVVSAMRTWVRMADGTALGAEAPRLARHELRHVAEVRHEGLHRLGDRALVAHVFAGIVELADHRSVRPLDVEEDGLGVAPQGLAELAQVVAHLGAVGED